MGTTASTESLDRWAVIRQAAARTLARFEAETGKTAFSLEHGSYVWLPEIARLYACPKQQTAEQHAFALAHAVGHVVLAHPVDVSVNAACVVDDVPAATTLRGKAGGRPVHDTPECYELEANVFAAELLAPLHQVRERVTALPDWTLNSLAAYFGLSPETMAGQLITALLPGPGEDGDSVVPGEADPVESLPPLDARQQEAAQVRKQAALVVAGPGAGKTRVLTERYRYLVEQCGAHPDHILCLTFANKAADEMRHRLGRLLPEHAPEIQVSTFHSLGLQLVTTYGPQVGLPPRLRTASEVETFVLLRQRLPELNLQHFEDLVFPTRHLRSLLDAIGRAKSELMGPDEYAEEVARWQAEVESLPEPADKRALAERRSLLEKIARFAEVAHVYQHYQNWLQERGWLDYGDLVLQAVRLFDHPATASEIRARYQHILVDEFQDINRASGRLIQALDGGRQITWAVGDPRQGIFRFQGASAQNLFGFPNDYPNSRVFRLQNNYRSLPDILTVSAAVAFPAKDQHPDWFTEDLMATRDEPVAASPAVTVARTATLADEYAWLAQEITALHTAGRSLGDMAVLCRTREQAQAVSRHLETQGIPTGWDGLLQSSPLFKDLMAVLAFAAGEPKSLVRLGTLPEHALCTADVKVLLQAAQATKPEVKPSLEVALSNAQEGALPDLSPAGQKRAGELLALYRALSSLETPWEILIVYLFEQSRWARPYLVDATPEGIRARTTLGQVLELVRDFRAAAALSPRRADGEQSAAAFLHYIALALESGRLETPIAAPSRLPNAVHLLTRHGSKGLQWPIVFLPHLVDDTRKPQEDDLPLPRFLPREHDPLDSDEREEACLLYVALTRAQDRLYLSASRQGRWSTYRDVELHRLLAGEVDRLEAEEALVLQEVPAAGTALLKSAKPASPEIVLPERGWEDRQAAQKAFAALLEEGITHSALQMYADCGQKFLYYYGYRLDDGENRHRLYHKVIRRVMKQTAAAAQEGEPITDERLRDQFLRLWAKASGEENIATLAESRLATRGLRAMQAFRNRCRAGQQIVVDATPTFVIDETRVSLRIDEMQNEGARWLIRKHQLTRRSKRHARDAFFLGLQLANQQMSLRMPRMTLHYLLEDDMEQPGDLVPPPPLGRVLQHKESLGAAIGGIRTGNFLPQPSAFKCRHCAFQMICPAS